jgi:hypothetical protein
MQHDNASCPQERGEDWPPSFAGFELTHTIYVASESDGSSVPSAAELISAENIEIRRWMTFSCGGVIAQEILVGDISERDVVDLRQRLAALDGVLRARVEHHFLRV